MFLTWSSLHQHSYHSEAEDEYLNHTSVAFSCSDCVTLQANFPVLGSEQVTDVSSSDVTTVSGWWGVSTTISGCDDKHTKELHYYLYF